MNERRTSLPGDGGERPGRPDLVGPLVARTTGLRPWRRAFHAASGVTLAVLLHLVPEPQVHLPALGLLAALLFLGDWIRLRSPALNRLFFAALLPLLTPREHVGPASSSWFVLGAFLTAALYPLEVAIMALLVLALADPVGAVIGQRLGTRSFGKGTRAGSAAFFVVAAPLLSVQSGIFGGILAAAAVTLVEAARTGLDDNLTVPLAAGAALLLAGALP